MAAHRGDTETPTTHNADSNAIGRKALWSRREAAALLSCSTKHLDREIARGELAAVRHGRNTKITAEELVRYVRDLPAYEPASA